AVVGKHGDLLGSKAFGRRLDGTLRPARSASEGVEQSLACASGWWQPLADRPQKSLQMSGAQICRRPAADEDRLDRLRLAEQGELAFERVQVLIDPVVRAGDDGKIAVAAVVGTKGDVHVRRPRPKPSGQSPVGGHVSVAPGCT